MIEENLNRIKSELPSGVKLVAVSKFHPMEAILEAYQAGQTVFIYWQMRAARPMPGGRLRR